MPFTYLSESTARLLAGLVGPIVVYQPSPKGISDGLSVLASRGVVDIRTPIVDDDDRVRAALAEFTDWARQNPGASTPGAGYFGARQGQIPFFDETTINRIRSDIQRYHSADPLADASEAGFSARLFLAVAQENDSAADHLDQDLSRVDALEKDFLDAMKDADDAAFNRKAYAGTLWREDPGAKLTGQRIRAWSSLAVADSVLPDLLVTTSRSVMETLMDIHGETLDLQRLGDARLSVPPADAPSVMGRLLADLATQATLSPADLTPISAPAADLPSEPAVTVTLFGAGNHSPAAVLGRMAPAAAASPREDGTPGPIRHTLFLLVER
jgi:hypothetical protein